MRCLAADVERLDESLPFTPESAIEEESEQ
jgi:hypothetical protein